MEFLASLYVMTWEYYLLGIILVPGIIFAIYAEFKVSSTFNKYSQVSSSDGRTAEEIAKNILLANNCTDTHIKRINGNLTDNYNHSKKTVSLSSVVYGKNSISAIGVAAHEIGHVIQYKQHYFPITLRNLSIGLSNFTSSLLLPLIIAGIILSAFIPTSIGMIFIWVAVASFGLSLVVNLVTLPVEYNASNRAIKELKKQQVLNDIELMQVKEVLNAAALTYVASLIISILSLLRIFLAFRFSRD